MEFLLVLGDFGDIGGSGLIATSWDRSGCDLAIKTSSSCFGEDSFSSLRSIMNASVGSLSTNSTKHSPCFTSRQMKESSSRGHIKEILGSLVKTHIKILKKYRVLNGKVTASGDEVIKMSPCRAKRFLFFLFKR